MDLQSIERISKWTRAIFDERSRQVKEEGWSVEHDDKHTDGSLANAAACYAAACYAASTPEIGYWYEDAAPHSGSFIKLWPWGNEWNKKYTHGRKKQLVIAGALILAELERLERAGEI